MESVLQTTALHNNLTDHPWRQPSVMDDKLEQSLLKDIKECHPHGPHNVLILGPVGAGKSSFINSNISIFKRSKYSPSTDAKDSLLTFPTRSFEEHLRGDTVFHLSDETYIGNGIEIEDSKLFVNSSIEKSYLFSSVGTFKDSYRHKFGIGCEINCVIFIVSAHAFISHVLENMQLTFLRRKLRRIRIPVALVLTKVDKICEEVGKDITKMFRSKKVLKVIKKASEMFEIKEKFIHPVVNYVDDSEMRTEKNIPLLLALRQTLSCTSEYLEYAHVEIDDESDDDDDKLLLLSNERRYSPEMMPMEEKLTTESMSLENSSAIDRERRYSPEMMPMEEKKTTESTSSDNSSAIDRVEKLLDENNLPENDDLQSIYKNHGRKYERLKVICEKICNIIKNKLHIDTVKNIWPARNLAKEKVVFVVEMARNAAFCPTFKHDLEILIDHGDATGKNESIEIMAKERDFLRNKTDEYHFKIRRLQPILIKHSNQLMDKHKNISAILPCVIRSVGYSSPDEHLLLETLCISIHVKRKISGLIPLDEEPIPMMVEGIPTDVIQGECRLFSNGPKDYHGNLKMGLAIHARAYNENGDILGGTLGCFVQHKTYGMCCITNAHIVLKQSELQDLFKCGYMEYGNSNMKPVFQPLSFDRKEFGTVVAAAGYGGNAFEPGLEVALIQILNRTPLSGSFPQSTSNSAPTFTFNTGNVTDVNLLQLGVEVFKYGMVTGPTSGLLMSHGATVRYNEGIQLHQQMAVIPATDESFAASGDSGSSVFVGFNRHGRESVIGLISGGEVEGPRVFVTPIYEILESVKCQPCLHRFENIDDYGTNVFTTTQCACSEETMDCTN